MGGPTKTFVSFDGTLTHCLFVDLFLFFLAQNEVREVLAHPNPQIFSQELLSIVQFFPASFLLLLFGITVATHLSAGELLGMKFGV